MSYEDMIINVVLFLGTLATIGAVIMFIFIGVLLYREDHKPLYTKEQFKKDTRTQTEIYKYVAGKIERRRQFRDKDV